MNNNCGGTSFKLSFFSFEISSNSTARSHCVNWSSPPQAAKILLSVGCHSTEVIGDVWCLNEAIALPLLN
uniref:Uncharacterized protein n=1 Tax=Ciona intestinalis TaxID=7719 RepID=H2XNW3_CIOIN